MTRIGALRRRLPPLLVLALGGAAAALSWDALRTVALTTGAVHHAVMAGVWATTVDLLWIACMRAAAKAKPGRRGWALAGLVVGVGFSGFQVFTPWTWLARMVPVTALLVAWMLETFVVVSKPASPAPAPAPAMEVSYVRTGPAPVDVAPGGQGAGTADRGGGRRPASAPGASVAVPAVERPGGRVGATVATHPVGAVENQGGPDWATVGGVGPDPDAQGRRGGMSADAAVRILIEQGVDVHSVRRGDIADDVRRVAGNPDLTIGTIGNALTEARRNASSNGGVKVR